MAECCVCCEPKYVSVTVGVISIGFWTFAFTVSVIQWFNLNQHDDNFQLLAILIPLVQLVFIGNITLSCLMIYGALKQSRPLLFPWLLVTALQICILLLSGVINYNNFYGNLISALVLSGHFGYFLSAVFVLLFYVYLWAQVLLYYRLIWENRNYCYANNGYI